MNFLCLMQPIILRVWGHEKLVNAWREIFGLKCFGRDGGMSLMSSGRVSGGIG
jgi:hypothetical protein